MAIRRTKTALMKASELLARQEQSSKALRRKLLERGYDETEVDNALAKLTENNYLNDNDACASQFENLYAEERLSVRQIFTKLIQRGFDAATVRNCLPDDTYAHELAAATKVVNSKFSDKNPDAKTRIKIRQHLAAKGFSSEIIDTAVSNFLDGDRN